MTKAKHSNTSMKAEFNCTNGNKFWSILQDANRLHMSVTQKYEKLLFELRSDRVAFKDIRNRLLKEAKKEGLYRKTHFDGEKMTFMSPSQLKKSKVAWYHELTLFLGYVRRNYSDYGTKVVKKDKTVDEKKKSTVITRRTQSDGTVEETRTERIGTTTEELTAPVKAELNAAQVEAIISSNYSILGKIAEEKGTAALEAFNLLMLELGKEDEIIEYQVGSQGRPKILGNDASSAPFEGAQPVIHNPEN